METISPLIAVHAAAAIIVLVAGGIQILRPRRDRAHRWLGRSWLAAMLGVCVTSFFIHPHGFSWLHGLAIWTLFSISMAIWRILAGDVRGHRAWMVGTYLGTLVAFGFAIATPGRLMPRLLASDPLALLLGTFGIAALAAVWAAVIIGALRSGRRGKRAVDAATSEA